MFKILQKFLPEIINLLLTFYLQARQLNNRGFPLDFLNIVTCDYKKCYRSGGFIIDILL